MSRSTTGYYFNYMFVYLYKKLTCVNDTQFTMSCFLLLLNYIISTVTKTKIFELGRIN